MSPTSHHDFLVLLHGLFVLIFVLGWPEDPNVVVGDIVQDLRCQLYRTILWDRQLTRSLNSATSSSVNVSALAITGIRLTLVWSRRMNSTSIGLSLMYELARFIDNQRKLPANSRVPGRLDKVDTRVDTVIDQLVPVHSVLLLEVGVESGLNVVDDGFPAGSVSFAGAPKTAASSAWKLTTHRC